MIPKSWKALQPIVKAGSRSLTTSDLHRQLKKPILVTQSSTLQKKINYYAIEPKNEPTIGTLMKESRSRDKNKLVRSCQFMHREFLVRISKVIIHLQNLPYLLLTNEDIKRVLDLYMYAFTDMLHQPKIQNIGDVDKFNETLSGLLDDLQDILLILSRGIHDSQPHFKSEDFNGTVQKIMDYITINRLCNRILARHHLSTHITREGYISVVNTELSLKKIINKNAAFAANVCQNVYMDTLPEVLIDGHADTRVAFIPNIIDYILREILKNSFRATVEANLHKVDKPPIICTICNTPDFWTIRYVDKPPIICTICNTPDFWTIRVSDRGTGMTEEVLKQVENYCYTSFKQEQQYSHAFGDLVSVAGQDQGSSLAGFGVGIPVSKAYVKFVGGKLEFQTMPGIGTDVYIKIPQLSMMLDNVRI
ncbi:hypothetical protein ACHWQZ_G006323 [Mnemiopsis leidyi]